jgi:putrescine transport system substrate-binding protein
LRSLQTVDPGSRHLLPWAWGYTGVGVNRPLVQKALGDLPWPDNAWQLIFDPVYTRRLAKCGLAYLDAPTEIVPAAALYLGLNPYQLKPEDVKAIDATLAKVRKDVRVLSTLLIDEFANGKVCVALVWGGDMHTAQLRAKELDPKADLQALVPKNGGLLFVDALAIPADAKRVKNAHAFIDFYLRADNAAKQTNEMGYLSGNLAATPLIDTAITGNPAIFLPTEQLAKMTAPDSFDNAARAAMAETYTRFKAGR